MMRALSIVSVLLLAALLYLAVPLHVSGEAFAQNLPPGGSTTTTDPELGSIDANGHAITCASLEKAKGGVLIGRIVPCIIHTIEVTTVGFVREIIRLLMPMFYAFLTLVITLFGVRVLQGEREIGVQGFMLVVKIALVFSVLEVMPDYVPSVYGVISDGVEITTGALEPGSFGDSCGKDINKYGDANTPKIWMQMDCVIGKLFGFTTGTKPDGSKTTNMVLSSSILGLMTGFFFGGTLGVAVFFALLGALWSIIWVVVRVVLAFINGYLLVCVMLLITPIFLPLALMKITNDYFEKWWRIILGGLLMPILVAAYSMFALTMYDDLLFKDNSRLQVLFDKAKIGDALQHSTSKCDFNVTNDPGFKKGADDYDIDELIKNPFLQNFTQPLLSGGSNLCGFLAAPKFKITDVNSPDYKKEREVLEKLFEEALQLFILAYLIAAGLGTVQNSINTMTGSSAAFRAFDANKRDENFINEKMKGWENKASSYFAVENKKQGATGADFMSRFSEVLKIRK